jgi:DNA-binding XRE family transcriptional regulator
MSKRGLKKVPAGEVRAIKREAERLALEIRSQRERLGLTQENLAERLDVSIDTVKGIELGYRFASLPMLIRLCRVLRLRISLNTL